MEAMTTKLLFVLFSLQIPLSFSGQTNSIESVPDLQRLMYNVADGYPCVRLLNLSGEIGCSNPGRDKVVAPIVRFKDAKELGQSSTILVSTEEIQDFFDRVLNNPSFSKNIGGVLVESESGVRNQWKGFSPAQKFPQAEFAPYHRINYDWNPMGSGVLWKAFNFPVFLLSESSTSIIQEIARKQEKTKKSFTADVAEFDVVMETTKAGTHNSPSCLKEQTCLPLGGYSVWSSLPPINVSSSNQLKPIVLAIASMDTASFFRDKSLGADSPISGLISLLAAADALSHIDGLNKLSKQLVFAVFTGEAWGYLGSRRFLLELDLQSDAVHGLNSTLIETVFEIGSVGKGFSQGVKTFFAHKAGVSAASNATLDALERAQGSLKSQNIKISSASNSNPGIPPSSLMSFLNKNSQTSGIVMEDFDTNYTNKYYHSHLDDLSNINTSAIVAAASLVARTLYILASNDGDVSSSALGAIDVNVSLVEELTGCLLNCEPGLSCELVKNYISPASTCPSHYVGVIIDEPSFTPYSGYVADVSRFIWNFLADKTSILKDNARSGCSQACNNTGEVCIKSETTGKGECVISTTRYVPAYSTRLKYESGTWNVLPPNSSDPMGMLDPVWTESNWNTIKVRFYTIQDTSYDRLVLLGGISITVLAYLAIIATGNFITKAMKLD